MKRPHFLLLLLRPFVNSLKRLASWPLLLWVKPHFSQLPELENPTRQTWYVLPRRNFTEPLLLTHLAKKFGLPAVKAENLLFLEEAPPKFKAHQGPQATQDIHTFWVQQATNPQPQQLITVSFFWGRAPGREEPLLKILTADSWAFMGGLRRLITVLLHGRQLWVEVGQPLNPEVIISQEQLTTKGLDFATAKSERLFRLYFRRLRTRMLGPDLSHRRTQRQAILASAQVKEALQTASTNHPQSNPKQRQDQALKYFNEIASNVSYPILLVFDRLLSRLWNRLYSGVRVSGLEKLRQQAGHYTLVYLPCHRSHIDYLLLSYVLFNQGMMPPHIAAGINLNMPILGPLLRRGGAFFMRRSFKHNPLYSKVFHEYLYQLYSQGHPVEFFMEGGRSRTGRTLPPKPGLLAMTVKAALRGTTKPLLLVPVYLGYEKVLEGPTYLSELKGKEKKKESPLDLLRVLANLRQELGQVDVSFGQPLALEGELLTQLQQAKPQSLIPELGKQLATAINQAATLNRVNLVALALLATSHRAMEETNLLAQLETLSALAGLQGVVRQPKGSPPSWISHCQQLGFIERVDHPLGPLYRCNDRQGLLLTWYRNNVVHLFALPSLVAFLFMNQEELSFATLYQQAESVYPLLANELFLEQGELEPKLQKALKQLQELNLIEMTPAGLWQKPAEHLSSHMRLRLLGQLVQPALERIYLLLALLNREGSGQINRTELVEKTRQMAQRLTLLQGLDSPEFADNRLFNQALDGLLTLHWLDEDQQQRLIFTPALKQVMLRGRKLFDPQLRHHLLSLTQQHPEQS